MGYDTENQFRCRIVLSAVNEFSLPNCVSATNSFRCRIVLYAATEFSLLNVYSAMNQVFPAELCCLQQWVFAAELCVSSELVSLPKCVFCSEWVFAAELCVSSESISLLNCVVCSNRVFAAELCIPQGIRCSLPNCVVRNESGFRCQICVVHRESGVHCQNMLSAVNQVFVAELCCP